jgi:hypothetical protein
MVRGNAKNAPRRSQRGPGSAIGYSILPNPANINVNMLTSHFGTPGGTYTFTITRSDTSSAETIFVSTEDDQGYANVGAFTDVYGQSVDFAAGQSSAQVTITVNPLGLPTFPRSVVGGIFSLIGVGQPPGSAIYFAVDFPPDQSTLAGIIAYFQGIQTVRQQEASHGLPTFAIGVYGAGLTLSTVTTSGFQGQPLATYTYLADAPGWPGSSTYQNQNIAQIQPYPSIKGNNAVLPSTANSWSQVSYIDTDKVFTGNYGQWIDPTTPTDNVFLRDQP